MGAEFGWSGPSHVSDSGGEGRRLTTDGDGSVEYDGGGGDGNDGGGNRGTDRDYILKGGGGRGEGGGGVYSDLRGGGEGGRKEGGRDDILYGGTTGHTLSEKVISHSPPRLMIPLCMVMCIERE